MRRRAFVGGSVAYIAMPAFADTGKQFTPSALRIASAATGTSPSSASREGEARFTVTGAMEQGSLALGTAPPGSQVALDGRPLAVTAGGRFAFGFAYDQTKPSLVTVRYPEGGGDSRSFTPAVRQYEIQRVNGLPQETVTPPPQVLARIDKEAETIYLEIGRAHV